MSGNNKTFNSLLDLYSHVDRRVIFDPSTFVPRLIELGDIYTEDTPGMYDQRSGSMIIPFDGYSCFTETVVTKNKTFYEDRLVESEYDLDKATSDIRHRNTGRILLRKESLRHIKKEFRSTRPIWFRARELAIALAADVIERTYTYRSICRSVRRVDHCVQRDEQDAFTIENLDAIEERIRDFILYNVGEPGFNEIVMDSTRSMVIIDVRLDIRIRDWHERQIREEINRQEQIDAHGQVIHDH